MGPAISGQRPAPSSKRNSCCCLARSAFWPSRAPRRRSRRCWPTRAPEIPDRHDIAMLLARIPADPGRYAVLGSAVDRAEAATLTALATGIYRACLHDLVAHGMQVRGLAIPRSPGPLRGDEHGSLASLRQLDDRDPSSAGPPERRPGSYPASPALKEGLDHNSAPATAAAPYATIRSQPEVGPLERPHLGL